ncbi:hypothetical protein ACLM5J_09490 [Nocardioides sp. Bht2]
MLAILLSGFGVVGCADDGPAPTLQVEVRDWSGWDPQHRPTPERFELLGEQGEEVTFTALGDELTVRVVERDGDEITVRTSAAMAPESAGGGIGLRDPRNEFTVQEGRAVTFATPTTDAGTTVEISWR